MATLQETPVWNPADPDSSENNLATQESHEAWESRGSGETYAHWKDRVEEIPGTDTSFENFRQSGNANPRVYEDFSDENVWGDRDPPAKPTLLGEDYTAEQKANDAPLRENLRPGQSVNELAQQNDAVAGYVERNDIPNYRRPERNVSNTAQDQQQAASGSGAPKVAHDAGESRRRGRRQRGASSGGALGAIERVPVVGTIVSMLRSILGI